MSLARTFAVVVLALLLTTTLVTANVVAAAHLIVLDPEFVTETIEEEDGYAMIEETMGQAAGGGSVVGAAAPGTDDANVEGSEDGPDDATAGPVDTAALFDAAITEAYVRSQTEANVHRTYAYLHGNRETLNLSVATAPIRENVSAELERQIRNASLVELLQASGATLDGPVNVTVLERMTANESSYEAVKTDLRSQVRAEVLDEAVNQSFADASNDELLNLVIEDYDPQDYSEEEKAQMVEEREEGIRTALRERIEEERGDEIDAAVQEQLDSIREKETETNAETETEEAAAAVQTTVVRGLTTDTSYQEFRSDLDAAKADLASTTANQMDQELAAEFPDRIDLTENMRAGGEEPLGEVRTAVQWLDRLAFILPVVGLGIVGLLYYVRRSVTAVASDTGWSLLSAGVPTVVGVELAQSRIQSIVPDVPAEQQPAMDLMVGLVGRVMNAVGDVALVLTVSGVVLVGGSLAVRYGLVDGLLAQFGDGPEDAGKS